MLQDGPTQRNAIYHYYGEDTCTWSRYVGAHRPHLSLTSIHFLISHLYLSRERFSGYLGRMGRSFGDIPGVRFKVIKVNDVSLREMIKGKIEKAMRR